MKKKRLLLALAVLVFCIALAFTLYPLMATRYNETHQSQIHMDYLTQLEETDNSQLKEALQKAKEYNETLHPGVHEGYSKELLTRAAESYAYQLNVLNNGVMGYIRIPKLDVRLPIFHGTSDQTLENGVGHLLGSSLPVGGENTHAVLTGHSGMASQRMFSDISELEIGDVFYLEVLGETLAYEVTETYVVLPHETEKLEIEAGEDLCTLVTCTPFGVNTHRLLVRGSRIPYRPEEMIEESAESPVTESNWNRQYLKGLTIGAGCAGGILLLGLIAALLRRKRHG